LALLALAIEEPKRAVGAPPVAVSAQKGSGRDPAAPKGAAAVRLFRIPLYRDTVIGYTAQTFALGGFAAWAPKYLYRTLGLDLKTADYWFGLILVVTGILATFEGGQLD
jgi:hypothetical protein